MEKVLAHIGASHSQIVSQREVALGLALTGSVEDQTCLIVI